MRKDKNSNKIILMDSKKGIKVDFNALKNAFTQQVFTIIIIMGALLTLIVYMYVYKDYQLKTEQVVASNNELSVLLDQLEEYHINMEKYKKEMEEIKTNIQERMDKYPADVMEEDVLMFAVGMQERSEVEFDSISMSEKEGVYTVPQNMIQMAEIEGYETDITFGRKQSVFSNTTNYENLKGCVEQIFISPNRIGITEIIYVKDEESGLLNGTMDLFFYHAMGTDKEYVAPDMDEYVSGISDLFGSSKVVNKYEPKVEEQTDESGEAADTE